ncbi:phosphonate degradation HD-domain oxygenase [Chromobacterium violaceum]|uniref:phosphonate degradation HD-domain oxygenase n=1 Tax=Chromobacterium violaceum TaxID=536 RepID=UPI0035A65B9F
MFDAIAALRQLYRQHGARHYGEAVSQFDHAIQAATLARDAGCDDELTLAAFLHDVGHLLEHDDAQAMGGYGVMAHDKLARDYLLQLGFSPRLARLVGMHVEAKRYLCAIDPAYLAALSPASAATLGYQGGPMRADEADAFSRLPDLADIQALRRLDEAAKDGGWSLDAADWVWPLMAAHLGSQRPTAWPA